LFVKNRQLVIPGDLLAKGEYAAGENVYKEGDGFYASKVGLVNSENRVIHVIAIEGGYLPSVNDLVVGKVVNVGLSEWVVDINSPYRGILFVSQTPRRSFDSRRDDLTDILDVGDVIVAKVLEFDRTRDPRITIRDRGLGKVTSGYVIKVTPTKIPRLIGKRGSMIKLIKSRTGCQITVGQNGFILVRGKRVEDEALAVEVIRMIERDAHTSGLTNRVGEFIGKRK
jgi:exosome complex component RRP4